MKWRAKQVHRIPCRITEGYLHAARCDLLLPEKVGIVPDFGMRNIGLLETFKPFGGRAPFHDCFDAWHKFRSPPNTLLIGGEACVRAQFRFSRGRAELSPLAVVAHRKDEPPVGCREKL